MKTVPGGGSGRKQPGCLRCSLRRRSVRGLSGSSAAVGGAFAALADVLELVLDLRQPAAQVRVLRLQVGDPLLQGGDQGQDGGLGLGWDRVPERCGDRRWRNHTLYYEASVQRVRPGCGGRLKDRGNGPTNCLWMTSTWTSPASWSRFNSGVMP